MKPISQVFRDAVVRDLEIVYAITLLEYHNKIYLSYDTKRLNEEKQRLLRQAIENTKTDTSGGVK